MDKKIGVGMLFIIVIILIGTLLILGSAFVDGYKVSVSGNVSYNGVTGWDATYKGSVYDEDGLFDIKLWYYPWETKDIKVEVKLVGHKGGVYTGETWLGTSSKLYGSDDFTVDVHYVPVGEYDGEIIVYEVDKGFIGFFEESKTKVASVTFETSCGVVD